MTSAGPLSRVVRVDALPKEGQTFEIEASPAERAAVAAFNKLPSIEALTASLNLRHSLRGGVRVTGAVHADLTQVCVVSLDPFPASVDEDIDVRFAPAPGEAASPRRLSGEPKDLSMADDDEPDPIIDGKIDLGALVAEFLTLGLDPYPRKPGVLFDPPDEPGLKDSPFSTLAEYPGAKPKIG
jgi:hypothetical protein